MSNFLFRIYLSALTTLIPVINNLPFLLTLSHKLCIVQNQKMRYLGQENLLETSWIDNDYIPSLQSFWTANFRSGFHTLGHVFGGGLDIPLKHASLFAWVKNTEIYKVNSEPLIHFTPTTELFPVWKSLVWEYTEIFRDLT